MRQNFEVRIEGRRESEVCENAMQGLGRLLPARFFVLAKNRSQYKDFMSVIQRGAHEGIYVSEAMQLKGLRDPVVVQIGFFQDHPCFLEIAQELQMRGRITNVTVTDWR